MAKRKPKQKARGALDPEKFLTDKQLTKLRAYASDQAAKRKSRQAETDRLILEILALSGLRASEVCHLKLADTPHVHGHLILKVREGKGKVSRNVHISKELAGLIGEYIAAHRQGAAPDAPLIETRTGTAIHYRTVWEKVRRLFEGAGLRAVRDKADQRNRECACHTLRHTYATRLYAVERDLRFVQDQLGHADSATTAIYARTVDEARRRQAEKMI